MTGARPWKIVVAFSVVPRHCEDHFEVDEWAVVLAIILAESSQKVIVAVAAHAKTYMILGATFDFDVDRHFCDPKVYF